LTTTTVLPSSGIDQVPPSIVEPDRVTGPFRSPAAIRSIEPSPET